MKFLSAEDAKSGFGRLTRLDRAEPVAVAEHGGPVVALEGGERLKYFEAKRIDCRPSTAGKAH